MSLYALRQILAAVVLLGVAGAAEREVAGQDGEVFVFRRICNIEPGQEAAAAALARDMAELVERKYPFVEMSVRTGRWMTGFQSLEQPVDQIMFAERHPDPDMRRDFADILQADDEFGALQLGMLGVVDFTRCTETRFRERP